MPDSDIVLFWGPSGVERAPARGPEHFPYCVCSSRVEPLVGSRVQTLDAAFGATVVRILASAQATLTDPDSARSHISTHSAKSETGANHGPIAAPTDSHSPLVTLDETLG